MIDREWTQGNWSAWVVYDCEIDESRKRCRKVPPQFRDQAISHARTYWDIQGKKPKSVTRKPKSVSANWGPVKLYMTPDDFEYGAQQLAKVRGAGNTAPDDDFGNLALGFAAERPVDAWLNSIGIEHSWNNAARDRDPDFVIQGQTVDLKTAGSKGGPKPEYECPLKESQRLNSVVPDWYLFARYNNLTEGDLWVIGFATEQTILERGAFTRKGNITPGGVMTAPCDCWTIQGKVAIPPERWLNEKPRP